MLLNTLKDWSPFRVDALGIITILGADEVNAAVGRLVHSRYTSFLPFLGANVFASNAFTRPIPGFVVYNIEDGIVATDPAGWFERWLLSQKLEYNSTIFSISAVDKTQQESVKHIQRIDIIVSFAIGVLTSGALLTLAILSGDWWGLVAVVSMVITAVTRQTLLQEICRGLDFAVSEGLQHPSNRLVKTLWITPEGHAVIIYVPTGILTHALLTTPSPLHLKLYWTMRGLCWVGFGCLVVSLGMSSLFIQLLSCGTILFSTLMAVFHFGEDDWQIGLHIKLSPVDTHDPSINKDDADIRAAQYMRLRLTEKEENSMCDWNLFPHKSNETWWSRYRSVCRNGGHFRGWDQGHFFAPKIVVQSTDS